MLSLAPHSARGTIAGSDVAAGRRAGALPGGSTPGTRTRPTWPTRFTSIRSDGPTHHGLPMCLPVRPCASAEPELGPSSSSGAAGRQPVHSPERNEFGTPPGQARASARRRA